MDEAQAAIPDHLEDVLAVVNDGVWALYPPSTAADMYRPDEPYESPGEEDPIDISYLEPD